MAGMPWVKLWTDMLDDPKLAEVDDVHKWRFVQLVLLAGQCDNGGRLVDGNTILSERYISRRLGITPKELAGALGDLEANRLISHDGDAWCVVNFAKRQGRSQSELRESWRERQRRYRSQSHDDTDEGVTRDSLVTPEGVTRDIPRDSHATGRDVTPPEGEAETETEAETEGEREHAPALEIPPALKSQPRPPTRKQAVLKEQDRQTNPAILAWRNVFPTARPLEPIQISSIIREVTDPVKWGELCAKWGRRGSNPNNIDDLLDVYANGWTKFGKNGNGSAAGAARTNGRPAGRGGTFRRAQVPDSTPAHQEEARVEAAYRIKQRAYCKANGLDPLHDVIDRAKVEEWARDRVK